jgi:hypothetical protein
MNQNYGKKILVKINVNPVEFSYQFYGLEKCKKPLVPLMQLDSFLLSNTLRLLKKMV